MHVSGAGRYAPSPSGSLHLGNLRTALLAWLFARSSGRKFFVRIEDVDTGRDAGEAEGQLADLTKLGLDWDGPAVFQTDRRREHELAIAELEHRGLVYECTCTRREILEAPSAPHTPPGSYPGTCRNRSYEDRAAAREYIHPRLPALRLRAPEGETSGEFDDLLLGRVVSAVDDFVLKRGDGAIAYNLAVVVDDAAMGVDQVVRGDDLASSTPRQILLQRLLGLPRPEYAHVPLVLSQTGKRLAKRDGAVTLESLDALGIGADEVRGMLAVSLSLAQQGEQPTLEQLLRRFDPEALPREAWVWQPPEHRA